MMITLNFGINPNKEPVCSKFNIGFIHKEALVCCGLVYVAEILRTPAGPCYLVRG